MQEARQAVLPGETYDFEYQPTSAGILQLEFSNQGPKMKVAQQIEIVRECRASLKRLLRCPVSLPNSRQTGS